MLIMDKISAFFEKKIDESNQVSFDKVSDKNKWRAYFYPSTYDENRRYGVIKNLKGIKDNDNLKRAEKYITATNAIKLKNLNQTFDVEHYKAIHKTLFNGLYSWAGEFRQVNMGKGNSNFCDYDKISDNLNTLFKEIPKIEKTKNVPNKFADELCKFYLKLNDIHAFREGNGRTQNQFISHFCEKCGYSLNLQSFMEDMKRTKTDYYNLFSEYNTTKDHTKIREFFFESNLTIKINAADNKITLSSEFQKRAESISQNLKKETEQIKQRNYAINRVR